MAQGDLQLELDPDTSKYAPQHWTLDLNPTPPSQVKLNNR